MDNILISKIKDVLQENEKILFAYIFGSFATGNKRVDSDVDIAIYVIKQKLDADEYLNLKRKLMDVVFGEVDLLVLNDANPLIKHEVFREGIKLFSKDNEIESNFIVHSLFEYEDMKKYYKLSYESMINRIRKEVKEDG